MLYALWPGTFWVSLLQFQNQIYHPKEQNQGTTKILRFFPSSVFGFEVLNQILKEKMYFYKGIIALKNQKMSRALLVSLIALKNKWHCKKTQHHRYDDKCSEKFCDEFLDSKLCLKVCKKHSLLEGNPLLEDSFKHYLCFVQGFNCFYH